MNELTLFNVTTVIARSAGALRNWQINDPAHPDFGGIYNREWGVAEPKVTGKFMVSCGYLALADALPEAEVTVTIDRAPLTQPAD